MSDSIPMSAQAEIRQMSLLEKVALLETVWAELSADPANVEIPQWHKDLLDQRESDLQSGHTPVLDWETAKIQIAQAIR